MITDLSDLLDQLESPGGALELTLDAALREPLRVALLAGLKHSLQSAASTANPRALFGLEELTFKPDDGSAYRKRLEMFDYVDHQPVPLDRQILEQCSGWLSYSSYRDLSRQALLAKSIDALLAEQEGQSLVHAPLSVIHEAADWLQCIVRNDTHELGLKIRRDVKNACGVAIPAPAQRHDEES